MKSTVRPLFEVIESGSALRIFKWLQKLRRETRTRILLLYAATMLAVVAASVPIFRYFLFSEINARVQEDLREEVEELQEAYEIWDAATPESRAGLVSFIDNYLYNQIPEDDNFHIVVFEGEFYGANPGVLPSVLDADSDLMQKWMQCSESSTSIEEIIVVPNPEIGSILYQNHVLEIDNVPVGAYIVAHLSAGERTEALTSVYIFIKVAIGVILVSFLLAWLGSRQLLNPVQQLSKTARSINETNLSQRLDVKGSGELAELALTFNTMMDRVQTAFDTQRNFINDASHELRTPLTIIQGHLELMDEDPEEQQETLDLVMDELSRMGRFVNDLLLLAKAERPDFLKLETIEIEPFMKAVFAKITALADRHWVLVNSNCGVLVADRQQITGALINLAQNAVQHTALDDTIELGVERTSGLLRFWVRDTGNGISQSDQERIFDRFARAAKTYRRSEGAGLGLAIVKTIAESHAGYVELISQVGIGSTFSLILPVEQPEERRPE
ncbi:ATP-binding protein [Oscillatoria sp. CS-180]|uniref:sensor histidine kinase n=1 Tax=Oscillatoria sp. CS-180 TaxID=3021720 RepID=UPI00232CA2B2|nr:ATP-binding protein [Oscillatoria sp. CS-180]MDB9527264.1 ATP-binding protein [Oscillatoria sp. CS-180]